VAVPGGKKKRKFGVKGGGKKSPVTRRATPTKKKSKPRQEKKPTRKFGLKVPDYAPERVSTHVVVAVTDRLADLTKEILWATEENMDVAQRCGRLAYEIKTVCRDIMFEERDARHQTPAIPRFKPYAFPEIGDFRCDFGCNPIRLTVGWTHPFDCPFWDSTEHTPF
jgi:hypothetical protein